MEVKDRDHARELISASGITHKNATKDQLKILRSCINKRMSISGLYRNTYRMNRTVGLYMTCKTDQFDSREAVSFNRDGFIGFAGWADNTNITPILNGIGDWLDEVRKDK